MSPVSTEYDQDATALRRREPAAVRAVVEQLARPLYRAARGMGFSPADAEDLVQDVFATFLRTIDRFEARSRVSTWIFGILRHKAQERRREFARDEAHESIDAAFEEQFDGKGGWVARPIDLERQIASRELALAIKGCLAQLPPALAEAFVLREMQELETPEVCKILGRSVTHLGVQIHRARTRLRACLERKGLKGSR